MTNQQAAPEALRLAESLERRTTSWTEKCFAAFELRRLHAENERLVAMVDAQQAATHVQNPAEIEHVAGGVSKNGPESNMAQQPAPSAAAATEVENLRKALQFYADKEHFNIADDGAWDTVSGEPQNYWCDEEGTATVEDGTIARLALAGHQIKFEADASPQPSPTAQAASSAVLKAIRGANMQLVRTGDDAFMLVPYKVATAQAADSVLEDAARLDWLDQNIFYREMDEWDAKHGGRGDCTMWVIFAPKGHQGSARNIIDAARKQGGANG